MKILLSCLAGFFTTLIGTFLFLNSLGPKEADIKSCLITTMYKIDLCQSAPNYVALKNISPLVRKTILLTEDSAFYNHHGFDWGSIEKNFHDGWTSGTFKKGGSTISQQLAKNMFLGREKTFIRKIKEAFITDRIERALTKDEIFERYLNVVEFGKNIYGIKSAATFYFNKNPSELDVLESAFLALILPNPVKYSSSYYRKELTPFAKARLQEIIGNLLQYNMISQEQYDEATSKAAVFFKPQIADSPNEDILPEAELDSGLDEPN